MIQIARLRVSTARVPNPGIVAEGAGSPIGGSVRQLPADIYSIEGRSLERDRGLLTGVRAHMADTGANAAASTPRRRFAYVGLAALSAASAVAIAMHVVVSGGESGLPTLVEAQQGISPLGGSGNSHLARWTPPRIPKTGGGNTTRRLPDKVVTTVVHSPTGSQTTGSGGGGSTGGGGGGSGVPSLLAEAQAKAAQLLAEAQAKADADLAEARKHGGELVAEATKKGNELISEARKSGDSSRIADAQTQADQLLATATSQATALVSASKNRGAQWIADAKAEGDALIAEAKEKLAAGDAP